MFFVGPKGSHFDEKLECSQAGPCNFDGAGKGCVIFVAQRAMAKGRDIRTER